MTKSHLFITASCLASFLSTSAFASATDQAHAYGLAKFGGTNQCGTTDMSHAAHTKSSAAFKNAFYWYSLVNLWGSSTAINNTSAGSNLFTDALRSGSCSCTAQSDASANGIDSSVVAYIHTHGGHSTTGKGRSSFSMGNMNAGNTCNVGTDTNFFFGNASGGGKLEIAVIKACQGADLDVFKKGGYRAMVATNSRFQVYNGFHGDSSCGNFVADYVEDYAANSFGDGVGENWIDEAYDNDWFGDDDCPTSIVYGNSKSARKNMFYNGGFLDRKLTNASKSGSSFFFVAGCEPSGGTKLPG
jgi:hypothetical protein